MIKTIIFISQKVKKHVFKAMNKEHMVKNTRNNLKELDNKLSKNRFSTDIT